MEVKNLTSFSFPLVLALLMLSFLFSTATSVYLKIFIQKRAGYKEFIISKYTGGISSRQFKWTRSFNIFYDFFMLSILSILSFSISTVVIFSLKSYWAVGLYLLIIILLTIIVPINKLKEITRPKWIMNASAPQGMIMVWEDRGKFSSIYNYIVKYFGYILFLLFVCFLVMFFLFGK